MDQSSQDEVLPVMSYAVVFVKWLTLTYQLLAEITMSGAKGLSWHNLSSPLLLLFKSAGNDSLGMKLLPR